MKLAEMKITEFLQETASSSPAPGGGSVAALGGALGASLASMVANLTIGKEKYADAEEKMQEILKESTPFLARLTELIDEDTEAFNDVMAAFRMPKETDADKAARSECIQSGYKKATLVPLETAKMCGAVLPLAKKVAEFGNPNSITDAGVAALLSRAGLRGAAMNVSINLGSIKDQEFVTKVGDEVRDLLSDSEKLECEIMEIVREKL